MRIFGKTYNEILCPRLFVFLLGILVLGSCNKDDLLNPDPSTLISDVVAFDTPERIENQVNGLYSTLKHQYFLGSYYYIMSDIRSGDFISSNLNAATGATNYQMNNETTTSEVIRIWERGYQAINGANVFIYHMENGGLEVTGEETGKQYIAEARLIRALSYYYLLQLYARPYWDGDGSKPGLPLRLDANTEPGNYDLARSSVKDTYAQIIEDLDFAESNLPDSYNSAFLNTTRAHKNTAIALKTKVYLSMGDYPDVIKEANKIVTASAPFQTLSGVHNELSSSFKQVFTAPYITSESVFSMPFSSQDSPGEALGDWYLPSNGSGGTSNSNGSGGYHLYPDGIVANTDWTENDERRDFVLEGGGKLWLTKFSDASPHLDYGPVIRYSEVLLNLAEALTQETNSVDARAVELLSAVRNRSDNSTQYSASDFANKDALFDAIITERRIEFLGEGIRNADIMRLGIDIPAKPAHSVGAVSPSDDAYIFPIPINELNLNNLMENN